MKSSNGDGDTFVVEDKFHASDDERDKSGGACAGVGKACGLVKFGLNFITRNGNLHHKTPVSPPSDVNELEYVSALHQCSSMQALRDDGSLTSDEIALYLKSRHGLDVDAETVRVAVLQNGLTADKDDDNGSEGADGACEAGVMDLVELTSALAIPFLLKTKHAPETANALGPALARPSLHREGSKEMRRKNSSRMDEPAEDLDVVRDALTHILEDCTGDGTPKPIDEEMVKDVLRGFGEGALAKDDELVREMVEVASSAAARSSSPNKDGARLDLGGFLEALTSDVDRMHDPGRYERTSTNFEDVWFRDGEEDSPHGRALLKPDVEGGGATRDEPAQLKEETLHDKLLPCLSRSSGEEGKEGAISSYATTTPSSPTSTLTSPTSSAPNRDNRNIILRLFTGQSFDYTTDNFRTRLHIIFVWFAFAAFYFSYLFYRGYNHCKDGANDARGEVVCPLVTGIVGQLLMIAELVIFGGPYILIGSIGNSIEGRETFRRLAMGITLFTLYITLFYSLDFTIPYWISTTPENSSPAFQKASLALGMVVVGFQFVHFIMRFIRVRFPDQQWYSKYFTYGNVQLESKMKKSGLFKVSRMLHNAHDIHRKIIRNKELQKREQREEDDSNFLSNFGKALNEYTKLMSKTTYIGGIGWTWTKIWDGTLFEEEGIWFSGRVVMGSVVQVILVFVTPFVYSLVLPTVLSELGEDDEAGNATSSNSTNSTSQDGNGELDTRGTVALSVGIAVAFLTSVTVTVLFLPTMVSTTLKFRRGALPSLRSEDFLHRYRFALDQATLIFGGMFFGVLFSSIAMAIIIGGFVYLILGGGQTAALLLGLVGNLLGLGIVLVSKIIVMQIIRFTHYAAFYRRKPFSTNLMTVAMECYAIGISIWFMVVRTIKIIVIGALYLGRIDTPLFANGIGIFGPLEIDNWPTVTRKEILIHEAHRHPYIETLGYLYMMQLRYRNGFAKRACSAWRLIFVLSLMPWMHKYRDLTRPEHFGDSDDDEDSNGPVGYKHSLFHGDAQTRRLLMQSMTSPKSAMMSMRSLMLIDTIDEDENASAKSDKKIEDSERAVQIKEEMKRLQKELEEIEARASVGQETYFNSTAEASQK